MAMTRRDLLSASAAALAVAPASGGRAWGAPLPREADIVVIGAGAAGIAAARRIQAANRKVIVVEASGQIGGRCLTDAATFGVPFDRGARWLHNPDSNPMVKLARSAGLDISAAPQGQKIRVGRRNALGGRVERIVTPARTHVVQRPRTPREDLGQLRQRCGFGVCHAFLTRLVGCFARGPLARN